MFFHKMHVFEFFLFLFFWFFFLWLFCLFFCRLLLNTLLVRHKLVISWNAVGIQIVDVADLGYGHEFDNDIKSIINCRYVEKAADFSQKSSKELHKANQPCKTWIVKLKRMVCCKLHHMLSGNNIVFNLQVHENAAYKPRQESINSWWNAEVFWVNV